MAAYLEVCGLPAKNGKPCEKRHNHAGSHSNRYCAKHPDEPKMKRVRHCLLCHKAQVKTWRTTHREQYMRTTRAYRASHREQYKRNRLRWFENDPKGKARVLARTEMHAFLDNLGLPRHYNYREMVKDARITDASLEIIAAGWGYPDFPDECVEEKGPKVDILRQTQLARAILEYRVGREYKVAWRLSRTESRMFPTVFDFYEWQTQKD